MAKIDESKQYKFSEIIAMLENSELPNNTNISMAGKGLGVAKNTLGFMGLFDNSMFNQARSYDVRITPHEINSLWTIKLPKEDKFYLKAPDAFYHNYLSFSIDDGTYILTNTISAHREFVFTQKEIDAMPFDTNFFEQIKVDD